MDLDLLGWDGDRAAQFASWADAGHRPGRVLAAHRGGELVATEALNIALALLFVLGFGWAVKGVAAATVCAEYGGLALGLWLAVIFCGRWIAYV